MSAIARTSGRTVAAVGTVTVALILVVSMWVFGWGFFSRATADFRGETEQREQTVADGSYRIAAYERFYDQCAAVQTTEATIAALDQELATGPSESRAAQIQVNLTALRASRAGLINEYNADARKEATAAQFRASDLPAQLDLTEESTSCAAS